jgi:hypothetical protein
MIKLLKNTSLRFSLLRNSLVQIFFWIIFFPGFFSGDSFAAVDMARTGDLTNSYTASWAIYVRLFSLFGHAIGLLTLLGGLLLVFAITHFTYSIFGKKIAAISSFFMTITPLVWGMGITLWHDIQMTSGLLLVAAFLVKIHKGEKASRIEISTQLILGAILVSFRPNGLPTLLVFSFLFILISRNKEITRYCLTSITTTAVVAVLGSNVILGLSPINNYFAQEWMRNDISCFANTPKGSGFVESNISGIGNTETWKSAAACTFLNTAEVSIKEKIAAEKYVPDAWFTLLKSEPLFVLQTHLKRNAYLNPIPVYGLPTSPFLHTTIEIKDQGIEWAFPSVAEKTRAPIRAWNAARVVTGWAGLWFALTLLILIGSKRRELLVPFLMSSALLGVLFIFAPIPDGRYAMFPLIVGQLALIGKVVELVQAGTNRRRND